MSDDHPPTPAGRVFHIDLSAVISPTAMNTPTFYSPIPDDHSYYPLIGRATARWAQFEAILELCSWEAMHIDHPTGSRQTSPLLGHAKKIAFLREKLTEGNILPKFSEAIDALEAHAKATASQRNRLTHDPWYVKMDGTVAQQRPENEKKSLAFGFNDVPEDQLKAHLMDLDALIAEAWSLRAVLLSK